VQPPASTSVTGTGSQPNVVTGGAPHWFVEEVDAHEHPTKQPLESNSGEHGGMQSPVTQLVTPPLRVAPPDVVPDPRSGVDVDPLVDLPEVEPPCDGSPADGSCESETCPPHANCTIPIRATDAARNFMTSVAAIGGPEADRGVPAGWSGISDICCAVLRRKAIRARRSDRPRASALPAPAATPDRQPSSARARRTRRR
jgi:hypothetical protein